MFETTRRASFDSGSPFVIYVSSLKSDYRFKGRDRESGEEIVELARRAVKENCQPIVAGGGDGTINAVASMLVGTDRTLGVLPLGTLNHFAKDLKIPLDLEAAARVCMAGREAKVDVGE